MDGRKWMVGAALLAATACSAAAPIGAIEDARQKAEDEAFTERPSVAEIFRDGRYTFTPPDKRLREFTERRLASDPAAEEGIDKLVVKVVAPEPSRPQPIVAFAMVMSDLAVEDPATWEGFKRGFGEVAGTELEEKEVDGVPTVYAETEGGKAIAIYYAKDLIIRLDALPKTERADLEDLAEYLIGAR